MLIKWIAKQTNIEHYQTERELKMENGNLNAYPDLIIYKTDETMQIIELEWTRKTQSVSEKNLTVYENTIKTITKFTELPLPQHGLVEFKNK